MSRKTTRAGHVRTTAILAGLLLPLLAPAVPVRAGNFASAAPADPPALAPAAEAAPARPSIVLVLTDDQDASLAAYMPNLKALARQGATFTRAYYNDPLCGPSRATILTGLYDHNTGVTANDHRLFYDAGLPGRTVAVWLHAAGYRTGFVGKYLNEYPAPAPATYVPPGWDYWVARLGETTDETWRSSTEFDYDLNDNGTVVHHGGAPSDYATDVYRAKAVGFVRKAAADGVPFFLELATHAPHFPATPAPRDAALFPDAQGAPGALVRRGRRQRQAGLRPRPAAVRPRQRRREVPAAGPLAAGGRRRAEGDHGRAGRGRAAGEHLRRVRLRQRLRAGPAPPPRREEHALRGDDPDAALRARPRRPRRGSSCRRWWATSTWRRPSPSGRARPRPAGLDGRSFAPLLRPGAPGPGAWRQAYPLNQLSRVGIPSWRGVRTRRYTYVEYATGERELYDNAPTRTSSRTSPRRPTRACSRGWRGGPPPSPPAQDRPVNRSRISRSRDGTAPRGGQAVALGHADGVDAGGRDGGARVDRRRASASTSPSPIRSIGGRNPRV